MDECPLKKLRKDDALESTEDADILKNLHEPQGPSVISFASNFNENQGKIRLFEINPDIVARIEAGESLKIIGGETGEAVLCTKDSTFSIKKVETSNHVYLVPPSQCQSFSIQYRCNDYYELRPIAGRIDQVESILRPTQYNGEGYESEHPIQAENLFSRSQLQEIIQASEVEITSALQKLRVIEWIDGKVRMISKEALREILRELISVIIENDWNIECIDGQVLSNNLSIDRRLLLYALTTLGSCEPCNLQPTIDTTWILNKELVSKATAHLAFISSNKKIWPIEDFLSTWASMTPGVDVPDQVLLAGIALTESSSEVGTESSLRYLPLEDLSPEPQTRITQLFSARKKFTLSELEPYLSDFVGGPGKPTTLLELVMQYTKRVENFYHLK